MKKLILSFAVIAALGFTSCSSDDDNNDGGANSCSTCDLDFLGTIVSTEYCDNGDGTYTVTTDGQSETFDFEEGQSLSQITAAFEAAGATCN